MYVNQYVHKWPVCTNFMFVCPLNEHLGVSGQKLGVLIMHAGV